MTKGERILFEAWRALGDQPEPELEFHFHPTRKWRFDFAWPDLGLAVEVEGGAYSRGRHTRGKGFEGDCDKYNAAAVLGWTVLRFTTQQLERGLGECLDTILEAMGVPNA